MMKKIEKIDIKIDWTRLKGGHVDIQETLLNKLNEIIDRLNKE
jgi:hypothetical protein